MKWIDYRIQRPMRGGEYLVYDGSFVRVDTWYSKAGKWVDTPEEMGPVRYWMEFPAPPDPELAEDHCTNCEDQGTGVCLTCDKAPKGGE